MTNPSDTNFDATRDPRTGRPLLPIDAHNNRKAEAESQPLTAEDNRGIAFDDGENSFVGEEDDLPLAAGDNGSPALSSATVNSTVPLMKAADANDEEVGSAAESTGKQMLDRQVHEGERPEALAKFAEVARNDDGQPVRNGTEATEQTAPIPTDPAQKQDAATRVLREGVLKQDQGAEEAIDRLPDRTAPRHRPQGQ